MRTPPARTPFRSGNPALSERVFAGGVTVTGDAMTVQGTINTTALLLVLAFATATASWVLGTAGGAGIGGWALGAAIAGLVVAIATFVRPQWSPVTGPLYALLEGVFLGLVSMVFEASYPGIATLAIFATYMVALVLGLFGMRVPLLNDASPLGILISVAIVVVAALNLVLDFDLIERGARAGAPRYMEWYAAFGLLVTLVWLYLELVRLLAKLRER